MKTIDCSFIRSIYYYLLVGVIVGDIDGLATVESSSENHALAFLLLQFAEIENLDCVVHFHISQSASDCVIPFI